MLPSASTDPSCSTVTLRAIFPTITVRRVGDAFHLDPGELGEDWLAELLPGGDPTTERLGFAGRL